MLFAKGEWVASRFVRNGVLVLSGCGGLVSPETEPELPPTQVPLQPSSEAVLGPGSPLPDRSGRGRDRRTTATGRGRGRRSPGTTPPPGEMPAIEADRTDADSAQSTPNPDSARVCLEGAVRCSGASVEICSSSGTRWLLKETCVTASACSSDFGECVAVGPEPGTVLCNGASLQRANDSRTGFETVAVCAADCLCDALAGLCRSPACAAGEMRCNGSVLETCNLCSDGFDALEQCNSPQACFASGGRCILIGTPSLDAGVEVAGAQ